MLHSKPSERYANALRVVVFSIWSLKFLFDPIEELATLPIELFSPPAPLSFLPDEWSRLLLSTNALLAVRATGLCACVLSYWRRFIPVSGAIAFLSILAYQCIVRGFGHTNHAEIAAIFSVFIYLLFSLYEKKRANPEPVVIALTLCTTYSLIGVHRIATGGLEIFLSDTIVYWAANNSSITSYFDFNFGTMAAESAPYGWALKFGFFWVTVCEIIAPMALFARNVRVVFLVSILGFHIGTLLTMNILFWENIALLLALFGPFLRNKDRRPSR